MLARNFLSAAKLGISNEAREALITVLGRMERGEYSESRYFPMRIFPDTFYMGSCKTCVLAKANEIASIDMARHAGLLNLYSGYSLQIGSRHPTMEEASYALSNFLTTGWPDWEEVLTGCR